MKSRLSRSHRNARQPDRRDRSCLFDRPREPACRQIPLSSAVGRKAWIDRCCTELRSVKAPQARPFFASGFAKNEAMSRAVWRVGALVHGSGFEGTAIFETAVYGVAALRRTDFGRAQASIRLRTAQPMATSVCCTGNDLARKRFPMMDLYRPMAVSTSERLP